MKRLIASLVALVFATAAYGQSAGTVTNHAFAIGKGPATQGYTSLLCGSAQLAVGQAAADPVCRTVSGDATLSAAGALTLGTVNANVGTFGSTTQCVTFTVNAKGLITAASQAACSGGGGGTPGGSSGQIQYNNAGAFGGFTAGGDLTVNTGTGVFTFGTVNASVGTFGSATQCAAVTVNAKGLVTAASQALCAPAIASVTGLGTGVATALAVNIGSAGAPVLFNGAGGTPSSLTLTNATGLPVGSVTGLGSGVATALGVATGTGGAFSVVLTRGTAALGTSAIASTACASVVTVGASGVATTDIVQASFNSDPSAVTGYIPSTAGMLTIFAYPTANNVNFKVCNNTASSITPGAVTVNYQVTR